MGGGSAINDGVTPSHDLLRKNTDRKMLCYIIDLQYSKISAGRMMGLWMKTPPANT